MKPDKILIIAAKFNDLVTKPLVDGAQEYLISPGCQQADLEKIWVPGSFELPLVAKKAAKTGRFRAIICLGAVIRGETPHFDFVAGQAAAGVMNVGLEAEIPIIFGVLTTNTVEEALNRCGLKHGNKGADAASTALQMIKILEEFDQ